MSFTAGLVTVTFRRLPPREVVEVARRADLVMLEWGGDVHVPPGDLNNARQVRAMTNDAGLEVLAYGSYVRLGEDGRDTYPAVIDTAGALGAPAIRVWAGRRGSAEVDADFRRRVADAALEMADLAAAADMRICYEFHPDTLTDTDDSAAELLAATRHPHIRTLWQPPHEQPPDSCIESLRRVLPLLHHVHVFHWPVRSQRAPLADGASRWEAYIDLLARTDTRRPLLLEFVQNDDPAQLLRDAATLHDWIRRADHL